MTFITDGQRAQEPIAVVDPELWAAMVAERERQTWKIELIASENYASAGGPRGSRARGSPTSTPRASRASATTVAASTWTSSNGSPRSAPWRSSRAPSSSTSSPTPARRPTSRPTSSVLEHGDRILGMSLAHGGHLTHGHPINFSGRYFEVHSYGVSRGRQPHRLRRPGAAGARGPAAADRGGCQRLPAHHRLRAHGRASRTTWTRCSSWTWPTSPGSWPPDLHPSPFPHADIVTTTTHKTLRGPRGGLIFGRAELAKQIDRAVFPGTQGGPLMHVIAAKAVALLEAQGEDFREDQRRTLENAVDAGRHARATTAPRSSPAARTTTSCSSTSRRSASPARRPSSLLDEVGITVNKNAIPFDPLPPNTASGIRVGTPATTTRGFGARRDAPGRRAARAHPAPARRRRPPWPRCRSEVQGHLRPLPGARACPSA